MHTLTKNGLLAAQILGAAVSMCSAHTWLAHPEVIPQSHSVQSTQSVQGRVFEDLNHDGTYQPSEPGVSAVKVSNGLDVTLTDTNGNYSLPVRSDMNVFVIQPSGWEVPVDERMIPQFFYIHKEGGTPETLRFSGLPDTGPAPRAINFPLRRSSKDSSFRAAVIGDSQTYSNREIGYFRDSAVTDMLNYTGDAPDFMLFLGDVVGDDLGLLDRIIRVGSAVGAPQWLVHGNHDIDMDASSDNHSSDTWRRIFGPQYYAFEVGEALFIALDNVVYPCGAEDMKRPGREFCGDEDNPTYNGRVPETQMRWLENLLALTPEDKLIVFAHHIPFVSFVDPSSTKHQTDNLQEIFNLVKGRPALSLSGHTHTMENHAPGQFFAGWEEAVGIKELPFRHIIAGAASGSWYNGDLNYRGVPMSFQRMGAPKGVLMMDFFGINYSEHYLGGGVAHDKVMWTGLNTPRFREWYTLLEEWTREPRSVRESSAPPVSINDLADTALLTPDDLAQGVWATANIWTGSSENRVSISINGADSVRMERTQSGTGETVKIGAEYADPFAAQKQLSVSRVALESTSGNPRAQGYEAFRGSQFGPAKPQPAGRLADRNMHLWRYELPKDLPIGTHTIQISNTDRQGKTHYESFVVEIVEELPPPQWRHEVWK
jgi:3',5'-cyclic AMP phosphodiesterase CpdA